MIKIKGRNYYINEKELSGKPYMFKGRYFVDTKNGERIELEIEDYCNLGGTLAAGLDRK